MKRTICGLLCGVVAKRYLALVKRNGSTTYSKLESPMTRVKQVLQSENPAGADYILCKLTKNSPLSYHTRDKLGCCTISYRTLNAFFSSLFLAKLSPNLKLSFNRSTPTPPPYLYLTNLYVLFVLFCYPGYDNQLITGGAKC